jgi:hypothetical protein
MKKYLMALAALVCCGMTMAVLTACTEIEDNPSTGGSSEIVGTWYSNVSGKTFAKWNYGETWQNTEFKADGTGSTRIFYTLEDNAIGCEKIDFTYTASADGSLTMTSNDREAMNAKWQMMGDELRMGNDAGISLSFKKTTSDMAAKFDKWSKTEDIIDVPQPAKHTVFVYGNAGGDMDTYIEFGFWERIRQYLTDHNNVRVICFYKYGMDQPQIGKAFSGKYAEPGDIVWFELTDQTDLNTIKEEGFQAHGLGDLAKMLQICNPNTMRLFLECSSLQCPAENYSLTIWGHGSGFNPLEDVPGKYEINKSATRGVIGDEWLKFETMDMYEMYDAVKAAGIDRLNTLYFHNCYMGNVETLTQVRELADYIVASAHVLDSDGQLLTEFVRGLAEKDNAEDAVGLMFERCTPTWQNGYIDEANNIYNNGDYKMIRTDKFDAIIDASKRLCDRIMALYPTQQESIDRATKGVYRYDAINNLYGITVLHYNPFFDIANYAQLLAKETGDAELKAISAAMDQAFKEAFVHYRDVNNSKEHLDHYTLSVCLLSHDVYSVDYMSNNPDILNNYNEGYEKCDFHKLTGWGNWLNMNQQALDSNPHKGGGGKLE